MLALCVSDLLATLSEPGIFSARETALGTVRRGGSVAWDQCRALPIADVDDEFLLPGAGSYPRLCCDHAAAVGSGAGLLEWKLILFFDATLLLLLVFVLLAQEILAFAAIVQLLLGEGVIPL